MKSIKLLYQHVKIAVLYGEWYWGWEWYENKPKFGFFHHYYDGNIVAFHLGKFWIEVYYY